MIEDKWKDLIKNIVRKHLPDSSYKIFIFGSRAEGKNREWSDVDIGIEGPEKIKHTTMFYIKDDLEESDIPYKVDVVDFLSTSDSFRNIAKSSIISL